MNLSQLKTDCRHFRGDIPCKPHKLNKVHCIDQNNKICSYYDSIKEKILIIKLGAVGDIIRSTPLLRKLKLEYPNSCIFWLTHTPEVIPGIVDKVLEFNLSDLIYLRSIEFDLVINLDKDKEACALANELKSKLKKGFILKNGLIFPADESAIHKYLTGIFDDLNKKNTKSYLVEIFEICGYSYSGERYILSNFEDETENWNIDRTKKVIGLNTGCGGRWETRLWKEENWIESAKKLISEGFEVILLGGKQEDEKNNRISNLSGAKYFGHFSLKKFVNLVSQCDLVITAVTMAMHISLALNKRTIIFNNIFNSNEFELFGIGKIIEPSRECKCYFSPKCTNLDYKCMDTIEVERVLKAIKEMFE